MSDLSSPQDWRTINLIRVNFIPPAVEITPPPTNIKIKIKLGLRSWKL